MWEGDKGLVRMGEIYVGRRQGAGKGGGNMCRKETGTGKGGDMCGRETRGW